MTGEERTLTVTRGGFGSLDAALSWVVGAYDKHFDGRQWVSIQINPVTVLDLDGGGESASWDAVVSGPVGP